MYKVKLTQQQLNNIKYILLSDKVTLKGNEIATILDIIQALEKAEKEGD